MDRLWAPWRMSYVSAAGIPLPSCIFCRALEARDDRQALVLHRAQEAFLILNAFPYASGHLMAVVTRHVAGLEDATQEELSELMQAIQRSLKALTAVYKPDGFNVGINQGLVAGAGVPGHLHVHVVPRWRGDTSFMAAIGETRVLPESLETTYDRLSAALRS